MTLHFSLIKKTLRRNGFRFVYGTKNNLDETLLLSSFESQGKWLFDFLQTKWNLFDYKSPSITIFLFYFQTSYGHHRKNRRKKRISHLFVFPIFFYDSANRNMTMIRNLWKFPAIKKCSMSSGLPDLHE